MHQEMGLLHIS